MAQDKSKYMAGNVLQFPCKDSKDTQVMLGTVIKMEHLASGKIEYTVLGINDKIYYVLDNDLKFVMRGGQVPH